jgi:hypothetical protein
MDTQELINKLTKAISFQFKTDKTAPGLTIASLKTGYYCSVIRYDQPFGKGKVVFCKAKGTTLSEALSAVSKEFLSKSVRPKDPVQELDVFVSSSK